jgi:hypothetical protein
VQGSEGSRGVEANARRCSTRVAWPRQSTAWRPTETDPLRVELLALPLVTRHLSTSTKVTTQREYVRLTPVLSNASILRPDAQSADS